MEDVSVRFGGVVALNGLTFTVDEGQMCALIGPNGAGKTTLFNVISRLYEPTEGKVTFAGQDLLAVPPHRIARIGIARTFQNVALFPGLSVRDNVLMGAFSDTRSSFLATTVRWPTAIKEERSSRAKADDLLDELDLSHVADRPAVGLPYGTLKRVELARALASNPRMLMLDEPATGLTHGEVGELADLVRRVRDERNLTVLLGRAPHGDGDADLGEDRGARLRRQDRRGRPRPGPQQPPGHRGLPRRRQLVTPLLEVRDLEAGYGPVEVLRGMSFTVDPGEVVVILGANGAGKTTTIRAVSGMIGVRGTVAVDGQSVAGKAPEEIVRRGVAHVPQGRGTFVDLTVEENLRLGAFTRKDNDDVAADMERWYEVFPRLRERREQVAGGMSGGEQQMLAIARAAMSRPRLLLLDEPSLGLAPLVTQELFRQLQMLNQEDGMALLVVEQNANLALSIAERGYVLEAGTIVVSGSAAELQADESVRKAYLGI